MTTGLLPMARFATSVASVQPNLEWSQKRVRATLELERSLWLELVILAVAFGSSEVRGLVLRGAAALWNQRQGRTAHQEHAARPRALLGLSVVLALGESGVWLDRLTAFQEQWAAAKIQYQPALPHQREFLTQNMPVGHMIKFIITYQTAFWREKGYSGEIAVQPSNDCPFSVTFDATSPNGNAALVGFIAGQQASQWSSKEAAERRNAVLSSLVKYLGSEAASFIHYEEKDWAMENYSGGCPVNVMSPGLLTYYHPSLRKPCGRIHWSGTETATQWCGYMSGAVQAGQRAALEVLAEICPMKLTREDQEEIQHYKTVDVPAQKTPSLSIPLSLCRNKAVVIAILTISAAVLLIRHQNTIHKIKICFTSVPSTAMHYMFKV